MKQLNKLVVSVESAKKLQILGIECAPFLYWELITFENGAQGWEVGHYGEPDDTLTPAWTKTEIDYMIGPGMEKPDLLHPQRYGKYSDPDTYPIYFPTKSVEFSNGAEASVTALIFLIENEVLDVATINKRYEKFFQ